MAEYAVNAAKPSTPGGPLPYRLACLCDLRDKDGRLLLLKRAKAPNQGLVSPIGGKLDVEHGESPRNALNARSRRRPVSTCHSTGSTSPV